MAITFKIIDSSSASAKAFLAYVKTLDFVIIIEGDDYRDLSDNENLESNQLSEKGVEYKIEKSYLEQDISESYISESQLKEVELRRQNHLSRKSKSFSLEEVLSNARNSKTK